MINKKYEKLLESFPFLTLCKYKDEYILGVIQNKSKNFTSIYVIEDIESKELLKKFLDLCGIWWWESNRTLPVSIFLRNDFKKFKPYLRNYPNRGFEVIQGPVTALAEILYKPIKRKKVNLAAKKKST